MSAAAEPLSKSAKKRNAKKARDEAAAAGAAAEPAPPAPAAAPAKATAKAAAAAPKEQAAPAKAAGKAKAAAAPKEQAAPAKAAGKAKAAAAPKEQAAPEKAAGKAKAAAAPKEQAAPAKAAGKAAAAPKAEPEPKAKGKAKKQAKAQAQEPAKKVEELVSSFTVLDDGSGSAWEVTGTKTKNKDKKNNKNENAEPAKESANPKVPETKNDTGKGAGKGSGKGGKGYPSNSAASKELERIKEAVDAKVAALQAMKVPELRAAKKEEDLPADHVAVTITVPDQKVGMVIGPKGSKIQMLQEKSGAKIDTSFNLFTITGEKDAVAKAEGAIKDLISKGYTALAFDEFEESSVNVHPRSFPDLIGKQGAVIRKIKDELGVEISIPTGLPEGAAVKDKKYKVTIAGSKDGVEKAKDVINDIVMYYHHEITHPGEVHEELEVPQSQYSFIIGKGGSEMRHIQGNFKVKVYIPKEELSANPNVIVVGGKEDVSRAKAYIEKVIKNAAEGLSKREKTDDGDHFTGGDDEVDQSLQGYVYKRSK